RELHPAIMTTNADACSAARLQVRTRRSLPSKHIAPPTMSVHQRTYTAPLTTSNPREVRIPQAAQRHINGFVLRCMRYKTLMERRNTFGWVSAIFAVSLATSMIFGQERIGLNAREDRVPAGNASLYAR